MNFQSETGFVRTLHSWCKNTKSKLKELNLPQYSFKITGNEGSEMILDRIRKKYVRLTPEEWVRQNFVQYLINEGKYPAGLIAIEAAFLQNKLRKRVDILVHNRRGNPVMVVECKEPAVKIDEKTCDQIVSYNLKLRVPYILVTNGIVHYAYKFTPDSGYAPLDYIPLYEDIISESGL